MDLLHPESLILLHGIGKISIKSGYQTRSRRLQLYSMVVVSLS